LRGGSYASQRFAQALVCKVGVNFVHPLARNRCFLQGQLVEVGASAA
jgi:hypothetical protein